MDQPADQKGALPSAAEDEEIIELTEVIEDSAAEVVLELPAGTLKNGDPAPNFMSQLSPASEAPALDQDSSLDDLLATLKDFPEELTPETASPPLPFGPPGPEFQGHQAVTPAAAPIGDGQIQAQVQEVAQQALNYLANGLATELAQRVEQDLGPAIVSQVVERLTQECGPQIVQGLVERLARELLPQMAETVIRQELSALKKRWAEES